MKHYLNPNKVAKSFVLAGALSFGVFAGGQFTEAAGLDKGKPEQTVQVKSANSAKANVKAKSIVPAAPAVKVQAKDEVRVTEEPKKVNKSQASVHASETAKMHAAPNSAVLGKGEKVEEVVTEEVITETEEAPVQESPVPDVQEPAGEVIDLETEAATENTDSESEETADVDSDVAVKTEDDAEAAKTEDDEDAAKEEEDTNLDSDSAVRTEDEEDTNEDSDSENINLDTDAIVKTEDDEEAEAPEEDGEEVEKVNPSAANKAKSQASVNASENAKLHAAANSAVLAGVEASEEAVTDETTEEVTEESAEAVSEETTEEAEVGTDESTIEVATKE